MGGMHRPSPLKTGVFLLSLLPLAYLLWLLLSDGLGANPIERINRFLGDWALRFLLITLTVTPLRRLFGWHRLARVRRMLGLFCFFYLSLHLLSYLVLDQFFDWQAIWEDLLERPYITLGFCGFLLLSPLAFTSTDGWVRRLGRQWVRLHRLVYPAAVLAVTHFFLMTKADLREPLLYATLLTLLFGIRLLPRAGRAAAVEQR